MSRRINLWPIDFDFLVDAAGTGDASIKALIAELYRAGEIPEMECSWNDALQIATNVIDTGFPSPNEFSEDDCHFLASQMLSLSCQLNQRSPDSEFHWLSFLETIDVCFPGAKSDIYSAFADGRPWFGSECPFETVYGIIKRDELPRIVNALSEHRDEFGDDALWMVDPQIEFFEFVAKHNSDMWYAA